MAGKLLLPVPLALPAVLTPTAVADLEADLEAAESETEFMPSQGGAGVTCLLNLFDFEGNYWLIALSLGRGEQCSVPRWLGMRYGMRLDGSRKGRFPLLEGFGTTVSKL